MCAGADAAGAAPGAGADQGLGQVLRCGAAGNAGLSLLWFLSCVGGYANGEVCQAPIHLT